MRSNIADHEADGETTQISSNNIVPNIANDTDGVGIEELDSIWSLL